MYQVYVNRYPLDYNKFCLCDNEADAKMYANKFVGGHYVKV